MALSTGPGVTTFSKSGSTALSGEVTISEGANITLTQSGQNIAIAASGGAGSPGGSDTYVQFNDGSAFGGDAGFTYNKTTDVITLTKAGAGSIEIKDSTALAAGVGGGLVLSGIYTGTGTYSDLVKVRASKKTATDGELQSELLISPRGNDGTYYDSVRIGYSNITVNTRAWNIGGGFGSQYGSGFFQPLPAPVTGGFFYSTTPITGGSLTASTTYYYLIVQLDDFGNEGFYDLTYETSATTDITKKAINITFGRYTGIKWFKVYRSTTSGSYGATSFLTTIYGTEFTDDGSVSLSTGSPLAEVDSRGTGAYILGSATSFIPSTGLGIGTSNYIDNALEIDSTRSIRNNIVVRLANPDSTSSSTVAGGTLTANTNYFYVVTAYDRLGNSSWVSQETYQRTDGTNKSVSVSWNTVTNAYYKVFRSTQSNVYSGTNLVTTIYDDTISSYTDTGATLTDGVPPADPVGGGTWAYSTKISSSTDPSWVSNGFALAPILTLTDGNMYIPTNSSQVVSGPYEVASGHILDISSGAILDVLG